MTTPLIKKLDTICAAEGWQLNSDDEAAPLIIANGKIFTPAHPYEIHCQLYANEKDSALKFHSMKRIHDMLWPHYIPTWNIWTERRFKAHCEGYTPIVFAGGAAIGKSMDAAKIAVIFWFSDPRNNACVISSTTLDSLESRIWGYVLKLIDELALPIRVTYVRTKPPKILSPGQMDKIHGMFAIALGLGDDDKVIKNYIGRHPNKGLMFIIDEATDAPTAILKALPNLEKSPFFQCIAIGNSSSRHDLHGSLATPLVGWDGIDPNKDFMWRTSHPNGICLYFNPYDSPAIKDPDPVRRAVLGKFLITMEELKKKETEYGVHSDSWYRFVLGFWKAVNIGDTAISEQFLTENDVWRYAEWSGFYPINVVAGFDPAFQAGGMGCVLRLALLGQTVDGTMALDYRKEQLLFRIDIRVDEKVSGELQIARQVVDILRKYKCPLNQVAMDATGAGRALGELLRFVSGEPYIPYKIVSTRPSDLRGKKLDPSIIVTHPSALWLKAREFIQQKQIRGIDAITTQQLVNRAMHKKSESDDKLILESKNDYRTRMSAINPAMAHSPDESDAFMLCIQAAILAFGFAPGLRRDIPAVATPTPWQEKIQAFQNASRVRASENRGLPAIFPDFSGRLEDAVDPKKLH